MKKVTASVWFDYNYTESINQMIADGAIGKSRDEIRSYIMDTVTQDLLNDLLDNPNCGNIQVVIDD